MRTDDLDFQLWVNTPNSFEVFREWFKENLTEFGIQWQGSTNSGSTEENWLIIEKNDNYSSEFGYGEKDWLYYPYVVTAIYKNRIGASDDVIKQTEFAHQIISKLEKLNCTVKMIPEVVDT